MIEINRELAEAQMRHWAACSNKDLPDCFERFFQSKRGVENQWQRLTGIRFGKIEEPFLSRLAEASKVHLSLGVLRSQDNSIGNQFNILIRVDAPVEGIEPTFYQAGVNLDISDDPLKPGLVFGPTQSPIKAGNSVNSLELTGVRPALKNQYCTNWCMTDSYAIPQLFDAEQPDLHGVNRARLAFHEIESQLRERNETGSGSGSSGFSEFRRRNEFIIYNPFNRARVRGHFYVVSGYSLRVLKNKIALPGVHHLTINLGMNPGGIYFNKNQFSLVFEILTRREPQTAVLRDQWKVGTRDGLDVVDMLFEVTGIEQPLFAPNIVLENPPHRFWLNNEFIQGEMHFNQRSAEPTDPNSLSEVFDFEFVEYSSTFDDFLHPCPPFCDPPPGGNG